MIQIIVIGVIVVAIVGAFLLVMRWGMNAKDETVAAMSIVSATRELLGEKHIECERLAFELATTKKDLTEAERLVAAFTEEIANVMERTSIGAGLPAGDVLGRLQRIAQARQAGSAGDPVPAKPVEAVHHEAAPSGSRDALMSPDD